MIYGKLSATVHKFNFFFFFKYKKKKKKIQILLKIGHFKLLGKNLLLQDNRCKISIRFFKFILLAV